MINNRYRFWYNAICARGQLRSSSRRGHERHHIIPRACGGSDDPSNLVVLTYREHFLVHWLLTKFTEGNELRKMQYALVMMVSPGSQKRIVAGWQYAVARKVMAEPKSAESREKMRASGKVKVFSTQHRANISAAGMGRKLSEKNKAVLRASRVGSKHTEQSKIKISEAKKGRVLSDEHRAKIGAAGKGKRHSEKSKALMSANRKGNKLTPEQRARISAAKTGMKLGPIPVEIRVKMGAAIKAAWARRKAMASVSTSTKEN